MIRLRRAGRDLSAARNCASVLHPDGKSASPSGATSGRCIPVATSVTHDLLCGCFDGLRLCLFMPLVRSAELIFTAIPGVR